MSSVLCSVCRERERNLRPGPAEANGADPAPCHLCLGIFSESVVSGVVEEVKKQTSVYSDLKDFKVAMHIPNAALFRRKLMAKEAILNHPPAETTYVEELADAARSFYGERLEVGLGARYHSHSPLTVVLNFGHAAVDEADCEFLAHYAPSAFARAKKPGKGRAHKNRRFVQEHGNNRLEGELGRGCIDACVQLFDPILLAKFQWHPSDQPVQWMVDVSRDSVVLGGRYVKMTRLLPHSLGFSRDQSEEGAKTTVEELLCNPLKALTQADACRFTSSGREDRDTRMVGEGRPFAANFINPRRTQFTPQQLADVRKELNAAAAKHGVGICSDIRPVTKDQFDWLKTGEIDKTKAYSALCFAKDGTMPSSSAIAAVCAKAPICIQQKTPVRVLNSRANLLRDRRILSLTITPVENPAGEDGEGFIWLRVDMDTEAGTYVKEFINSDFGRTTPSLASLLELPSLECHELDVTRVDLKWPPEGPHDLSNAKIPRLEKAEKSDAEDANDN